VPLPGLRLPGFRGAAELLRDYRRFAGRRFPLAMALMLGGAVAEGVGILALIPLLALAAGSADLPESLRDIGGGGLSDGQRFALAVAIFLAAMAVRSLVIYRRDRILSELRAGYEASLKLRSAESLAARGWADAGGVGQAGMQSLLLVDIPRCAVAVHFYQAALVAFVMLSVQFALAAFLSLELSLIGLGLIALGMGLSWIWIGRGQRSGIAISDVSGKSSAAAFRLHAGLKAALAQGTVPAFLREYRSSLADLTRESVLYDRDRALAGGLAGAGAALCAAFLLVIGDRLLELPFPLLLTILVLFARMSGPAQQLQQSLQGFAAHVPSFLAIERHMGDVGVSLVEQAEQAPLDWQELALRDLRYRHAKGQGGVAGISFDVQAGEWIGLAGPSGAGKTTIVDLIAGLLLPQQGEILVDGRSLNGEPLERWRRGLAYIGQADTVFHDSIRGNLLAEGSSADEPALWEALDAVGLADRVRAFSQGLDAHVGDRGSSLSGGERQRLTIARALLRHPRLLILDEATNALDAVSEIALLERLRALDPRPAAVVIAHRAAPLDLCDRVIHVEGGRQAPR
jgi:ATP-binding cassette subfamily C protein